MKSPKGKALESKKEVGFKRLKWDDYSKLSSKEQDEYGVKERAYNFDKKMERKYGPKTGQRKLQKFFGNLK